jgi:hypothetical protein
LVQTEIFVNKNYRDDEAPLTMPVPAAGKKFYGLGRNASYAAAKRGDIPCIKVGGRLRAIVRGCEQRLDAAVEAAVAK